MENTGLTKSLRVAVIGPESTGKSTLCAHLAKHFESVWVPEYAREHLEQKGLEYTYKDLLEIARKQVQLEDEITHQAAGNPVFIDTNLYVMKVWCEFVYNNCHWWILDEIAKREYDLYLLCDIDLPWEYQPMREYPDLEIRQRLFHMYIDILTNQHVPWKIIQGSNEERLTSAVNVVADFFSATNHYSTRA